MQDNIIMEIAVFHFTNSFLASALQVSGTSDFTPFYLYLETISTSYLSKADKISNLKCRGPYSASCPQILL